MPLYEYLLRVPGQPDETLISDRNGLAPGDEIDIRYRAWRVVSVEVSSNPRAASSIVLVRADAESATGISFLASVGGTRDDR